MFQRMKAIDPLLPFLEQLLKSLILSDHHIFHKLLIDFKSSRILRLFIVSELGHQFSHFRLQYERYSGQLVNQIFIIRGVTSELRFFQIVKLGLEGG